MNLPVNQKTVYNPKKYLWVVLISLFIGACSTDPEAPAPIVNEYLVESSLKAEFNQTLIKNFVIISGFPDFVDLVKYDIEIYTLKYKTTVDGEEVIASGVISIPKDLPGPIPYLSAHRGTIFADTEAPSENPLVYGFEVIASAGYASVLPDMIGFGETKDRSQYYYNKESNSQVTIDLIKAGKEFLREKEILLSDQLFLFGYSQGGFITLAAQQAIENDASLDWDITAVAAGAGSYNIEFVMDDVLNRGVFTSPAFLSLIIHSYNTVNNFGKDMDYYFQEPYASQIPGLLDGSKTQDQINDVLPDVLEDYFEPNFLAAMMDGSETQIINAFRANSVHNWQPMAPLRLYHSSGDQYIPIEDSENTAEQMKDGGSDVTFVLIGDGSHQESAIRMLIEAVPWFESLRTDL